MSNKKLFIIGVLVAFAILGAMLYFVLNNFGKSQNIQNITLEFWGVFDQPKYLDDVITAYERTHPNINIQYKTLAPADYEKSLVDAFAAGTGPDIWLMHNSWLLKHFDKVSPLPQTKQKGQSVPLYTYKQFKEDFVDVAEQDLTYNQQIYALPLYVDSLALYYNKDIFNSVGIAQPPTTWDEFNDSVKRLRIMDERGNIVRAGATIGMSKNVNRASDILTMLMLQFGANMTDSGATRATFAESVGGIAVGRDSLQYYTDFAQPLKADVYTWNDLQHYSIDAFAEGGAAMMINYSHHIQTLREKSGRFNFGVAPIPQPRGSDTKISYANYWAPTVSKQSKNTYEAWRFIHYLTSQEGVRPYLRISSRPAARRDLIAEQRNLPELGVFSMQALTARSWYQPDDSAVETILLQAIDDVSLGRTTPRDAIQFAQDQVNILFKQVRNKP